LYLGSWSQNRTYRYVLPGIAGMVAVNPFTGYSQTRDIAWMPDGTVWVASDWTSVTLKCHNSSGTMVDYIDASLVPNARGVTVDPEGFLWISDMTTDLIYKVDISEGIGSSGGSAATELSVSNNPFSSFVVLTGESFGSGSTLEIYDIRGGIVLQDSFEGSYTWTGASGFSGADVPAGSYFAVVVDGQGNSASARLIRI